MGRGRESAKQTPAQCAPPPLAALPPVPRDTHPPTHPPLHTFSPPSPHLMCVMQRSAGGGGGTRRGAREGVGVRWARDGQRPSRASTDPPPHTPWKAHPNETPSLNPKKAISLECGGTCRAHAGPTRALWQRGPAAGQTGRRERAGVVRASRKDPSGTYVRDQQEHMQPSRSTSPTLLEARRGGGGGKANLSTPMC